ncbi:MAG: PLP-dependent aspartate aminotransferase family protein [Ignavibacteriaceae bacterium]
MGFSTDAIHAGQKPDEATNAVITPIYMTSTYAQPEYGVSKGYKYGRTANLTRSSLEQNIATLEKGKYGLAFSSGVAAVHSICTLLKSGDHVIAGDNVYGGTYRLFEFVMKDFGLDFSWVDTSDIANIKSALKPNTKMIYVETPTNPLLTLTDLKLVAAFAKENNLITVCDNTFMSPYFQNPLLHGIDIALHSTTKYLNGHSDVIGGIIVTGKDTIYERLKFIQNSLGAVPSPFDCWLTLRSTKTLAVRMDRHNSNAMAIAKTLKDIHGIKRVIYPGLPDHPHHDLAKKQMTGFGGMLSLELPSFDSAKKLMNNVKVFTLAESLGGVESLLCHPYSMTHASVPAEVKDKIGLTDGLVRLSVGIEDVEDLIQDLVNAIK